MFVEKAILIITDRKIDENLVRHGEVKFRYYLKTTSLMYRNKMNKPINKHAIPRIFLESFFTPGDNFIALESEKIPVIIARMAIIRFIS
mgnify:FL=1